MFNQFFNKQKKTNDYDILIFDIIRNLLDDEYKNILLTENTILDEIGFDSIKYMQLLLSLEDVIKIDIEEIISKIDLFSIRKIKDILAFVSDMKTLK